MSLPGGSKTEVTPVGYSVRPGLGPRQRGYHGPWPAPQRSAAAFRPLSLRGILASMSTRPRSQAGDPMTLGNMRANGVRSLVMSCWRCHRAILSADPWPDHVPVPSFGPRMVCPVRSKTEQRHPFRHAEFGCNGVGGGRFGHHRLFVWQYFGRDMIRLCPRMTTQQPARSKILFLQAFAGPVETWE
jgi:hypothetical protein